jgi:hypothetical protein
MICDSNCSYYLHVINKMTGRKLNSSVSEDYKNDTVCLCKRNRRLTALTQMVLDYTNEWANLLK